MMSSAAVAEQSGASNSHKLEQTLVIIQTPKWWLTFVHVCRGNNDSVGVVSSECKISSKNQQLICTQTVFVFMLNPNLATRGTNVGWLRGDQYSV